MKIDQSGKAAAAYGTPPKAVKREPEAARQAQVRDESVEINPLSSRIQSLQGEPSFDAAKVEAIKQAIASGEFKINADAIADGLIRTAKELLGR